MPKHHSGFTLTELLVAIGLLAIIMISVSTIFRSTGETVSAGLAITNVNRQLSAAETAMRTDIVGYSADPFQATAPGIWPVNVAEDTGNGQRSQTPFLIIRSESREGYLTRDDLDLGTTSLLRTDQLTFFANGIFKRQTGGEVPSPNQAINPMAPLPRAMIWYGHLWLPNNADPNLATSWYTGGAIPTWPANGTAATNPNNFFGSQLVLGRAQILLADAEILGTPSLDHAVVDRSRIQTGYPDGIPVYYLGRNTTNNTDENNLEPLGARTSGGTYNGIATTGNGTYPNVWRIFNSRFDIAALRNDMNWSDYADLIAEQARGNDNWAQQYFNYRFRGRTMDDGSDWSNHGNLADLIAQSSTAFIPGCVNFIVEFAGDYVTQNETTGNVENYGVTFDRANSSTWHQDGVIDWVRVPIPGTTQYTREIQWYGLPRDMNGNGSINHLEGDVVPVAAKRGAPMPFETAPTLVAPVMQNYLCAWDPRDLNLGDTLNSSLAPKLIRITMQVFDEQGRLSQGMTRQFVFPVRFAN